MKGRGVGSIKRLGGGAPASRAPKKFFPEMLATGGGEKIFPVAPYRNCTFWSKLKKKTWKFPNKKADLPSSKDKNA